MKIIEKRFPEKGYSNWVFIPENAGDVIRLRSIANYFEQCKKSEENYKNIMEALDK